MASIETTHLGPDKEDVKYVLDGVKKMTDRELWRYLTHLSKSSALDPHAVLGDGGPSFKNWFVVNHFKSKA